MWDQKQIDPVMGNSLAHMDEHPVGNQEDPVKGTLLQRRNIQDQENSPYPRREFAMGAQPDIDRTDCTSHFSRSPPSGPKIPPR